MPPAPELRHIDIHGPRLGYRRGGLGEEVNLLLRLLALPGAEYVLPIACTNWLHGAGVNVAGWLAHVGLRTSPHLAEVWESYGSLADGETRTAFVHTLRSVVDVA